MPEAARVTGPRDANDISYTIWTSNKKSNTALADYEVIS